MAELFPDLDGAETIEYKAGLLVRLSDEGGPAREWYFEFRDDAYPPATARAATADTANGLPDPNVATIEVYGYSGVKEINGRKLKDMSKAELDALIQETNKDDALLLAGHIATSFDGGKTLYGFTPAPEPGVEADDVVKMLRAGKVLPGRVALDTEHYEKAAQRAAEKGWDTHLTRVVVTFDPAEQPTLAQRAFDEMAANQRGEHEHGYRFPPRSLQPPQDSVATNGQPFPGDFIANCATYPRFLGIPIPESSAE